MAKQTLSLTKHLGELLDNNPHPEYAVFLAVGVAEL